MAYALFLDDERFPAVKTHNGLNWIICRTFYEACNAIHKFGFPEHIAFDNDIGSEKEGYNFAKFIVEYDMDNKVMPKNFTWFAHTQNCEARDNINCFLNNYVRSKNG